MIVFHVQRKPTTLRTATARAEISVSAPTVGLIRAGEVPKGDPLAVARVAAVQAVKNTPAIVPFCHPVRVDGVAVTFDLGPERIVAEVTVTAVDRTGVEVEAMTGAAVAALTLYDMLKMLDDGLAIDSVRLLEKRGGKTDRAADAGLSLRAAVLVLSDSVAAARAEDHSGKLASERLTEVGMTVVDLDVLPDDREAIEDRLRRYADDEGVDLVVTTGGTGCGPRDVTPEATAAVLDRPVDGIVETARVHGQARTPRAMLSRGRAGLRGTTLIVNLPGSVGGVADALDAILPGLPHVFAMLRGERHSGDARPEPAP